MKRFTSSPSWLWHNLCNPYSSTVYYVLSGECVTSPILSHHCKNLKWQMDRCYSSVLQPSFICHPQGVRAGQPKRKEEKPALPLNLAPLFMFFFFFFLLPLSLPYVNWASQEGCLFYLRFSLWSLDLPLFHFRGLFPFLCFRHHHSGLVFPILTT